MTDTPVSAPSSLATHALLFGITLLCLVTANLVAASALLIIGETRLEYSLIIALLLTMGLCWIGVSRWFKEGRVLRWFLHMTLCCGVLFGAVTISINWLDTSIDGQGYQADGILSLAEGWNPYRTMQPPDAVYFLWIGLYSKGPWINAATLYRLTGTIEAGKAFQMLLFGASLAIAWSVLGTQPNLPRHHAVALSLLLAFNPVSVYQFFSFYVDGQMASCLTILLCLLWLLERSFDWFVFFAVCMVSLLIVNLKLNGVIYVAVFAGGYVLWLWLKNRPERLKVTIGLFAMGIVAVLVIGYNPFISQYITQFLTFGNPFYPGEWPAVVLLDNNTPVELRDANRFTRLALSIFSQSQVGTEVGTLKIPFTVHVEEFLNFRFTDTRLGGFGPLFSGVLITSLALGLVHLWQRRPTLKQIIFPVFLLLFVALSLIISDQGWWARFAPQLWMIPIITFAVILSSISHGWLNRATVGVMLILFVNAVLILVIYISLGLVDQQAVRQDLAALRAQSIEKPLEVNFNEIPMTQWRFDREGIAYHVVDDTPQCADGETLRNVVYSLSIVCSRD